MNEQMANTQKGMHWLPKVFLCVIGVFAVLVIIGALLPKPPGTPLMKSSSVYYGGMVSAENREDFDVHDCTLTLFKGSQRYDTHVSHIAAHAKTDLLFASTFLNKYGESVAGRPDMFEIACHDPSGREIAAGRQFD